MLAVVFPGRPFCPGSLSRGIRANVPGGRYKELMCSPPLAFLVDLLLKVSPYSILVMPISIGLLGLAMQGELDEWITKQGRATRRARRERRRSDSCG